MKNSSATPSPRRGIAEGWLLLLAAALFLAFISPSAAQQKDKKKKNEPPVDTSRTILPMSDEAQIDYMLSEALGAWQIGDVEKLHSKYSDDVSLVNGSWAPPILGWTSYLAIYQEQRTHMQRVSLERSNTYIKVKGNVGWACYQWDFSALVDGKQMESVGHTTVVVEKRNDHWVIVHNHTSLVPGPPPAAPASQPSPTQPEKPAGKPDGR